MCFIYFHFVDWSDYTPSKLKQPVAKELKEKKGKVTGSTRNAKWCKVAEAKLELYRLKKQALIADHNRKKDLHDLQVKYLKEEHDLKMSLLRGKQQPQTKKM
ncbi:uncharacterized protein LOC114333391 [Diabrotica virgifera virgifera]|uniref:Uncharacterized protein n=1 Tax=Diabrotica virgifera virgifera TaxID=50390 RepID=A0ABM5KTW3_DIAVI|nr:uncharacterized protein LOC114333391 [Diabrotica virgifera virgifera]